MLSLDLLILFGGFPDVVSPDGAADIAFKTRVHRGANFFSVIGFNTVGTNAARGKPLVFMSPLDFLDEDLSRDLSRGEKLAYLEAVSQDAPSRLVGRNFDDMARLFEGVADDLEIALLTRDAVAAARDIDDNPIDILPVMIHEFGHGFGLCDMRPAAYEVSCNRQYRTELTRASIMAFGGYKLRRTELAREECNVAGALGQLEPRRHPLQQGRDVQRANGNEEERPDHPLGATPLVAHLGNRRTACGLPLAHELGDHQNGDLQEQHESADGKQAAQRRSRALQKSLHPVSTLFARLGHVPFLRFNSPHRRRRLLTLSALDHRPVSGTRNERHVRL